MKKFYFLIAVFFSLLAFCTKESPTAVSEYSDSIVLDLYGYSIWCMNHNYNYYGPVIMTQKGNDLLKAPLDQNLKEYNSGPFTYPLIPSKYPPGKFEAFVYDSLPLIQTDSTDPELLVKSYSNSMHYFFRLDSATASDSVQNPEKGIKRLEVSYLYGFGFYLPDYTKWGLGKIIIYYNK